MAIQDTVQDNEKIDLAMPCPSLYSSNTYSGRIASQESVLAAILKQPTELECLKMSCVVRTSNFCPVMSRLLSECRRLWNPNRCPGISFTPALIAAGRR